MGEDSPGILRIADRLSLRLRQEALRFVYEIEAILAYNLDRLEMFQTDP